MTTLATVTTLPAAPPAAISTVMGPATSSAIGPGSATAAPQMRRSVIATFTTGRHVIAVEDAKEASSAVSLHQRFTVTVWAGDKVVERRYYAASTDAISVAQALAGYPLLTAS